MRPLGRRPGIPNPRSWPWIPGSRGDARPGMTVLKTRDRIGVLDLRGRGEMRTDQCAPLGKVVRFPKIFGVVFQRVPFDVQAIARRLFDGAVQLETFPALASPEDGFRFGDRGFKILFAAGLDV